MVQSMTGFGSGEKEGWRVEVRSLNHRFLEIYVKAPSYLFQFEMSFREAVKKRFSRGKFDLNIMPSDRSKNTELVINTDIAGRIYSAFKKLRDDLSIPGELDINAIAGFREVLIEESQKYDINIITAAFDQALDSLYEMRVREGTALASEMLRITESLGVMNEKIRSASSGLVSDIKQKFGERIKMILEGEDIDGARILQEAAVIAARLDISEEIARIDSHISQFREILANGDIIGRRLDFILQELNREVNTIASKSADYSVSSLAVEMKTEIEKMREQVQNIQ